MQLATFFAGTRLEGTATVVCPNAFARDWILKHYSSRVAVALGVESVDYCLETEVNEARVAEGAAL